MFNGVSNAFLYTANRIRVTFVSPDQKRTAVKDGTAFLITTNGTGKFLVTNRHMLDIGYGSENDNQSDWYLSNLMFSGFAAAQANVDLLPTRRIFGDLVLNPGDIKFAADKDEDVACVKLNQFRAHPGSGTDISFSVDMQMLADDSWIEQKLSVCDFVVFPGFPPWYDRRESRPILRTGTIASDPRTNYSSTEKPMGRRVAYEAFSFGGSSGSPVIATQKGILAEGPIVFHGSRECKVVGINAGHMKAPFNEHSGVSYFFKSSCVRDLIASYPQN